MGTIDIHFAAIGMSAFSIEGLSKIFNHARHNPVMNCVTMRPEHVSKRTDDSWFRHRKPPDDRVANEKFVPCIGPQMMDDVALNELVEFMTKNSVIFQYHHILQIIGIGLFNNPKMAQKISVYSARRKPTCRIWCRRRRN